MLVASAPMGAALSERLCLRCILLSPIRGVRLFAQYLTKLRWNKLSAGQATLTLQLPNRFMYVYDTYLSERGFGHDSIIHVNTVS